MLRKLTQDFVQDNILYVPKFINIVDCSNLEYEQIYFEDSDQVFQLDCSNSYLTELPNLKNLIKLNCTDCKFITNVPHYEQLEYLDCSNCKNLISISNMDSLIELVCTDCNNLSSLPDFVSLQSLDASGSGLSFLPILRNLMNFDITYTPVYKSFNFKLDLEHYNEYLSKHDNQDNTSWFSSLFKFSKKKTRRSRNYRR